MIIFLFVFLREIMQSQRSKLPFKPGAIGLWKKIALDSDRMSLVLNDIDDFADRYTVVPCKKDIFNMFRMIYPKDVKVVIVAQSPYPGNCVVTHVPYACGPALLPAFGCATTPATLRNVVSEACRDMCKKTTKSPRELVLYWIEQGVMLLNASLTLGKDCPKYLEDHSVTWEEVMRGIVSAISSEIDPIFLLIGRDAWKFEANISSSKVIKVSHPVARKDTSTPWAGSGVFSAISNMMLEEGKMPIKWVI